MLQIEGVGNLGAKPEKKIVQVEGEDKPLVTMRVCFNRRRSDGNGGFVDLEPLWRDVTIWKAGLGDRVIKHLKKGSRIFVRGSEIANSYEGNDGSQVTSCTVVADYVALDLLGIESVAFKTSSDANDAEAAEDEQDLEAAD